MCCRSKFSFKDVPCCAGEEPIPLIRVKKGERKGARTMRKEEGEGGEGKGSCPHLGF
jgi:hypothetical protein